MTGSDWQAGDAEIYAREAALPDLEDELDDLAGDA